MILLKKMLRDIIELPIQFFSIFLLSCCCVFAFCGITAEWMGIEKVRSEYYRETNLAELWINGIFSEDDLAKLKEIKTVQEAVARRQYFAKGISEENSSLYFICPENSRISGVKVIHGENFDPERSDGIWIYKEFADANGYSVNDTVTFEINGQHFETEILGLIISPEYQYLADPVTLQDDAKNVGYVFCSVEVIPSSVTGIGLSYDVPFSQITIKCLDGDIKKSEDAIRELFGEDVSIYSRDQLPGISKLSEIISVQKAMSVTFPALLLIIVIMSVATTINRLIKGQRIQVGTLRALGFQKRKLCIYYVNYFFLIVLSGGVVGCITGPLVLPEMFYINLKEMFSLPLWKGASSYLFSVGILFITLSCVITAYLSVNKLLQQTPACTLRSEYCTVAIKKNNGKNKPKKTKDGAFIIALRWNVRELRRNKIRTVLGCIGTVGCMTLLVCAMSCMDSVNGITDWMFDDVRNFRSQIVLNDDVDLQKVYEIRDTYSGECVMTAEIEMRTDAVRKTCILNVTEGKGLLRITDQDGKTATLTDGEISLSRKLANQLNIDIGDGVYFRRSFAEEWTKAVITNIHIAQSGQDICMTKNTYEDLSCVFKPNYIASPVYAENCQNDEVKEIQNIEKMNEYWSSMMESIDLMAKTMLFFAVLVAVTVLYNLGAISFVEQAREFAILKVQGFKSSYICAMFTIKNVIFALIGIAGGVLPGLLVTKIMCTFCGNDFDLRVTFHLSSFMISAVITLFVSSAVSLFFLKKIVCMDMVSSLKSTE